MRKFAVFILSHGRAGNIPTLKTLKNGNYTGDIYILVDDEDKQQDEYKRLYGDKVIIFSKAEMESRIDTGDNFTDRRVILYARNKCFEVAEQLGLDYFLELDDDYNNISYRKLIDGQLTQRVKVKQLDRLFEDMCEFLDVTGASAVAFGQGGDFIGGKSSKLWSDQLSRKCMNSIFCKTSRPFKFQGRINEDVNAYTNLGRQGKLFFTVANVMINQKQTQANKGGMTDIYVDNGTYLKTFYSVMYSPSCVKISIMGDTHMRIHHKVLWNNCVPKILDEKYKKR